MSNVINIEFNVKEPVVFDGYGVDAVFEKGSSYEELNTAVESIAENAMDSVYAKLVKNIDEWDASVFIAFRKEMQYLVSSTQLTSFGVNLLENCVNRHEVTQQMIQQQGWKTLVTDGEQDVLLDRLSSLEVIQHNKNADKVGMILAEINRAKEDIAKERSNQINVKLFSDVCQPAIDKAHKAMCLVIRGAFSPL